MSEILLPDSGLFIIAPSGNAPMAVTLFRTILSTKFGRDLRSERIHEIGGRLPEAVPSTVDCTFSVRSRQIMGIAPHSPLLSALLAEVLSCLPADEFSAVLVHMDQIKEQRGGS